MTERDLIGDLRLTRERFATLVAEIRPELHRYCARMTGSIADGEDVVQDTLARAYYARWRSLTRCRRCARGCSASPTIARSI